VKDSISCTNFIHNRDRQQRANEEKSFIHKAPFASIQRTQRLKEYRTFYPFRPRTFIALIAKAISPPVSLRLLAPDVKAVDAGRLEERADEGDPTVAEGVLAAGVVDVSTVLEVETVDVRSEDAGAVEAEICGQTEVSPNRSPKLSTAAVLSPVPGGVPGLGPAVPPLSNCFLI
jgi:hypothetical protein